MKEPEFNRRSYALRWLFWMPAISGGLLAVGKYFGFFFSFVCFAALLNFAWVWTIALMRAPRPTVYATLLAIVIAPWCVILPVAISESREGARGTQAVYSLKNLGSEAQTRQLFHPRDANWNGEYAPSNAPQ